jgi:hypothetical protein
MAGDLAAVSPSASDFSASPTLANGKQVQNRGPPRGNELSDDVERNIAVIVDVSISEKIFFACEDDGVGVSTGLS